MNSLPSLLVQVIDIYIYIIIIRAILSWFQIRPDSAFFPVYLFIIKITEPVLGWIRMQMRKLAPNMMIDFSPFIVIILLQMLRSLILSG